MQCTVANWEEMLQRHITCAGDHPLPPVSSNDKKYAKDDLGQLCSYLIKSSQRKTCLVQAPPAELILAALRPNWRKDQSKLGVGYERDNAIPNKNFYTTMLDGNEHINRTGYTLLVWHKSRGAPLYRGPKADLWSIFSMPKGRLSRPRRFEKRNHSLWPNMIIMDFLPTAEGRLLYWFNSAHFGERKE